MQALVGPPEAGTVVVALGDGMKGKERRIERYRLEDAQAWRRGARCPDHGAGDIEAGDKGTGGLLRPTRRDPRCMRAWRTASPTAGRFEASVIGQRADEVERLGFTDAAE